MFDTIANSTTGAISSFAGVIIAFVGFSVTIYNVIRSKRAASRAEIAANQALDSVRHLDTVQNLSEAIAIVEEIQRLNRTSEWKVVLDRHSTFRNTLIEIKGSAAKLDDNQKSNIQAGIAHSQSMSHKIEIALDKKSEPTDMPKMNRILSEQVENLGAILAKVKAETEG